MKPIHILLACTSAELTATLTELLWSQERLKIAGWAVSSREVLEYVGFMRPHLVLIDFSSPSLDTLAMIRQLKTMPARPQVVMMVEQDNVEYRAVAQVIEADGLLAKANIVENLLPLINRLFVTGALGETL